VSEPERLRTEEARIRRVYEARHDDARYSWLARGQQLIVQGAERGLLDALRRAGVAALDELRMLEVGCGAGHWLRAFVQWGARPEHVVGVDLLPHRIAEARARCAAAVRLAVGSGAELPFAAGTFDLVLQSTVLTSILERGMRERVAREMVRVLRPGGVVLWYDFFVDNPRNPDVRGVRRRELDALFPSCEIRVRRVTLAPPLARALAPRLWPLASLLSSLPFLCTHYVGFIRPAGTLLGRCDT
jgi:SAM-dependent methyltransferase